MALRIRCWGEYLDLRQKQWQEDGEKLHNEELRNLYAHHIVLVIKSRRMRWVGHVACMRSWEVCMNFCLMTGRDETIWRHIHRWEDNIKIDFKRWRRRREAVNILNKQSRTADKGWSSSLRLIVELTTPHRKKWACYENSKEASDLDGFLG
jgi:hypothetical protein